MKFETATSTLSHATLALVLLSAVAPLEAQQTRPRGTQQDTAAQVRPGCQIFVPAKPDGQTGTNWESVVTRSSAALSGLATLLPAVQQLR